MWWDDQGKLAVESAEIRGNDISNDLIFREAERFGIDARPQSIQTGQSSDDSNNSNGATMLFNFFGASEEGKEGMSDSYQFAESKNIGASTSSITYEDQEYNFFCDTHEVVRLAQKFGRDATLEQIEESWQANKDQISSLIKKRCREAKKFASSKRKTKAEKYHFSGALTANYKKRRSSH